MRIGCLQFAPKVGDIDNNINRADAILQRADPKNLDLIVLPELAFTGYNYKSLQHITPYIENPESGITALWARTTALKYECVVTAGYLEKIDKADRWPASPEYYNSAITINADGETISNYRKTFFDHRGETWTLERAGGFFDGEIENLGNAAMGICMDFNYLSLYKFETPWHIFEFANFVLHRQANLVILSMAWIMREDFSSLSVKPEDPDLISLSHWVVRLEPLIRAEDRGEIVVVLSNRCGAEAGSVYAGTSCVLGIDRGEVKVYNFLGRGEKELLIVDTSGPPIYKLVAEWNPPLKEESSESWDEGNLHSVPIALDALEGRGSGNSQPSEPLTGINAVLAEEVPAVVLVEPRCEHPFFGP